MWLSTVHVTCGFPQVLLNFLDYSKSCCVLNHTRIYLKHLVFCGTVCVWFYGQLTSDLFFRAYWCTFKGLIVAHTHNNMKVSIPSTTLALNCSNQYKTIKIKGAQSAVPVYLRKSERETFRMLIAILLLCCTLNQAEADIIQNYRWLLNHNTHTHTQSSQMPWWWKHKIGVISSMLLQLLRHDQFWGTKYIVHNPMNHCVHECIILKPIFFLIIIFLLSTFYTNVYTNHLCQKKKKKLFCGHR